jgi:hypothetical protein
MAEVSSNEIASLPIESCSLVVITTYNHRSCLESRWPSPSINLRGIPSLSVVELHSEDVDKVWTFSLLQPRLYLPGAWDY